MMNIGNLKHHILQLHDERVMGNNAQSEFWELLAVAFQKLLADKLGERLRSLSPEEMVAVEMLTSLKTDGGNSDLHQG